MSKAQEVQIFIQKIKKIKGIPTLCLVNQKVTSEEAAAKKLTALKKSGEPFIEVINHNTGVKTTYTKKMNAVNYTKKDSKV